MIEQIISHKDGMAVWWIGQDSWIIKSGDLVIATDLYLDDRPRIHPAPVSAKELAGVVDLYFVTHSHGDHFEEETTQILSDGSSCLFVLPESCLSVARKLNIPEERIIISKPREPFEVRGIYVEPVRAIHGNKNFAIYYEANLQDCGYVLTVNGKRIFQPGDSRLLEDHLFLKDIDILFFSPTEHNTHIEPSVTLITTLNPDYIVPQHHSTIAVNDQNRFWAQGYPEEVLSRLSPSLQARYHILNPGDMMIIE